jgi:hypothetical protein
MMKGENENWKRPGLESVRVSVRGKYQSKRVSRIENKPCLESGLESEEILGRELGNLINVLHIVGRILIHDS